MPPVPPLGSGPRPGMATRCHFAATRSRRSSRLTGASPSPGSWTTPVMRRLCGRSCWRRLMKRRRRRTGSWPRNWPTSWKYCRLSPLLMTWAGRTSCRKRAASAPSAAASTSGSSWNTSTKLGKGPAGARGASSGISGWLAGIVAALGENAVRQALVNARRVLGHLGLDLVLQIDAGHLGQPQQVDRHVGQFFPEVVATLAPGVECFGHLALERRFQVTEVLNRAGGAHVFVSVRSTDPGRAPREVASRADDLITVERGVVAALQRVRRGPASDS